MQRNRKIWHIHRGEKKKEFDRNHPWGNLDIVNTIQRS